MLAMALSPFSNRIAKLAIAAALLLANHAYADQFVYVPLARPCRLIDTRTSADSIGPGPLTAAHGPYLFGTMNADVFSVAQHGNSAGCDVPVGVGAISVNMNLINATTAGNIATWSADVGSTAPNIGTGVYNPSMPNPVAGQVLYNTGYSTISLGAADEAGNPGANTGKFYLQVANGQTDMTMNIVGYWLPLSVRETRGKTGLALGYYASATGFDATAIGPGTNASGNYATALGSQTNATTYNATAMGDSSAATGTSSTAMGGHTAASGNWSTAMGGSTIAAGAYSTAMGFQTQALKDGSTAMGNATLANGKNATAMGNSTAATGDSSTAMGEQTKALSNYSTAMGSNTVATGEFSTAMGYKATTNSHVGSFIYADRAHTGMSVNTEDNQFKVVANGGINFESDGHGVEFDVPWFRFVTSGGAIYSTRDGKNGVWLPTGAGSWATVSDRNAKTAVQPIDPREVLKKVVALPMNTWQYKTQEAKYRHLGPMAQDFYTAFHLGETDKGIDTVDADGVALAAIQGLNALLTEKDGQITALRNEKDREIAALRAELAAQKTESTVQKTEIVAQKARIASLESLAGDLAEVKAQVATLRKSSPAELTTVALRER